MIKRILFFLTAMTWAAASAQAGVISAKHDLKVELDPAARTLAARDVIEFELEDHSEFMFFLAKEALIESLALDGEQADYSFRNGRLNLELPKDKQNGVVVLTLRYSATFDDPYEPEPYALDNPGQGVTGTMTDGAVFLLGGSGWYPLVQGLEVSMHLEVEAPAGVFAVTGGRAVSHTTEDGGSVSTWENERSAKPQALFAGRYGIEHRPAGDARVSTYFLDRTAHLSKRYLEAAERHLQFFEDLHGDYLFPKFAVVENFFPTGYGFPSFTLLGSRVLRLPFIPDTSLRHEIAHCWWGNGVFVDYEKGNWSEGLTSYVSEHLSKETESAEAARTYRVRALTDYALLAAGEEDFPLSEFYARNSPATQAVGYGKAMYVFHMIRRHIGGDAFWAALRDVYGRYRFDRASWADLRDAFVSASDWSAQEAGRFFSQWVERDGAPMLGIEEAGVEKDGPMWRTTAVIGQSEPHYSLEVPILVRTAAGEETRILAIDGPRAEFVIETGAEPETLAVDPQAHVFRRLYDAEIPPTVNSIKGSDDLVAVFSAGTDDELKSVFRGLLAGLNHPDIQLVDEEDLEPGELVVKDVLFFGFPATDRGRAAVRPTPAGVNITADGFDAGGKVTDEAADSAFIAFKDPVDPARIKALFLFDDDLPVEVVDRAARKITHYGNYGLLAFRRAENVAKDMLRPGSTPLRVQLETLR
jgi:hypothetical protein